MSRKNNVTNIYDPNKKLKYYIETWGCPFV